MTFPTLYFGLYREVLARCRKIITGFAKSHKWCELALATSNTATSPGLLVLDGPSPLLGGTSHWHCYLLHKLVRDAVLGQRLQATIESEIFAESLQTSWGVLGLLAQANVMWLYPSERHRPLLNSVLGCWDELEAEGPRYSNGSTNGQDLWSVGTNLKFVMARSGVQQAVLQSELSSSDVKSLINQTLLTL
jgi:hypothetical protein